MLHPRPTLSLVLPIYNEEEVIPELHRRLQTFLTQLGLDAEVLFVNDGSRDRSMELLRALAAEDPRYRILSLSRPSAHHPALPARLAYARRDPVPLMAAALQHPPEVP